jgi:hypothetical protein
LHRKQPSPLLPWEEWRPTIVFVHTLRVILELVIDPKVCVVCEGWSEAPNEEPKNTDE